MYLSMAIILSAIQLVYSFKMDIFRARFNMNLFIGEEFWQKGALPDMSSAPSNAMK